MSHLATRLGLLAIFVVGCEQDSADTESSDGTASGDEWVHDPSRLVQEDGEWVLYGSGTQGTALTRSVVDLDSGEVLSTEGLDADTLAGGWWQDIQEWNATGEFDAPTVSDDGQFIAFTVYDEDDDKIRDATGVAVRTADGFVGAGVVLASEGEALDTPRAMDASFVTTDDSTFLVFGSHAGGIFITELDPATGLLLDDGLTPETDVASDRFIQLAQDEESGIEAPYIHANGDYYYLFVNKGRCCSGVDSTYTVVMGRAADIAGPYLDRDGVDLLEGGGSPFLQTHGRFIGPGHVGIQETTASDMVGFHFYDGDDGGISKYALHDLSWTQGWPSVGSLRATHRQ